MIDCGQQAMRTHCFSSSLHSRPRAVQAIIQPNRSRVAQPAPLQPGLQVHTVLVALTEHAALVPHPPLLGVLQSAVWAGRVCVHIVVGLLRVAQHRAWSCRQVHA